jgi:cbb3-type cytochrome oxidase subunit 3
MNMQNSSIHPVSIYAGILFTICLSAWLWFLFKTDKTPFFMNGDKFNSTKALGYSILVSVILTLFLLTINYYLFQKNHLY